MGRITRTNYGFIKQVQFSNAELLRAPVDSPISVLTIPGHFIRVHGTMLLFHWVADLTGVDSDADLVRLNDGDQLGPQTIGTNGLFTAGKTQMLVTGEETWFFSAALDAAENELTLLFDNDGAVAFTGGALGNLFNDSNLLHSNSVVSERRLWKRFSGEPFMVNPALGILGAANPRRRKGKRMAARRRRGKAYMSWVRSHKSNPRRRRRYRRNPFPIAGLAVNSRRRRYRRNPLSLRSFNLPPVAGVLYVGGGFVGSGVIEHFVTPYLPVDATTGQVTALWKWIARVGSVVGLSFIASATVGKEKAKLVAIGGGAYVLVQALKEFAPAGSIPGLNAYRQMGMGAYRQMGAARRTTALTMAAPHDNVVSMGSSRFSRF